MLRTNLSRLSFVFALAILFATGAAGLRAHQSQQGQSADAARLRALFFQRDYEAGVIEGSRVTALEPEARAWYLLNLTRGGREKDAIAASQKMLTELPANGWSSFALSGVRHYESEHADEAIALSQKALELLPGNADAIWLHAITLTGAPARRDEAIAFVEKHRAELKNPAELVVVKGTAFYQQAYATRTPDAAKLKAAFDAYAEARQIEPGNLNATFLPGTYLSGLRRNDEAFPLLAAAAKLAPNSTSIQQAYWRALNASPALPADARLTQVQALVDAFVEKNGDRAGALRNASSMYKDLKLTAKQRALEDLVLDKFADTIDAEWILAERWRELSPKGPGESNPDYRKTLVMYLERPKFYHEGLLGEAYRNTFFEIVADKSTKPEFLQRIVDGMLKYETMNVHIVHASVPVSLAENKILLDTAEKIARNSTDVMLKKVESQRDLLESEADYDKQKRWMVGLGYDALGWVLLAKGNYKDAEKELLRSYDLNHENRLNLFHLGKFYEETKDLTKAEDFYVKGLAISALGVNPSEAALKRLFDANKGAKSTFDEYIAGLREADRGRRLTKIMGERAPEPKAVPAFNLKTLDGKMVSVESLKGKVVAINFWGIWCGWCVHELPDYQKLYDQYKNDPDVVILTIDNDPNPNEVPPWMAQKKFTFPVLLDDGFVAKVGIQAFPTTWFLDREGKIAFTKVGWSEKLIEEFGWRIEAIKKK